MDCRKSVLKRERSANFNTAEVQLLVDLVNKHKEIIENKKTDAVTNKDKENAWIKIADGFNACGFSTGIRTWKTLKLKYEGVKKNTKKKSSLRRQEQYRTGGGPSKAPDFTETEEKVISICSNITGLEARHDSDTIIVTFPEVEVLPAPTHEEEEVSPKPTPEVIEESFRDDFNNLGESYKDDMNNLEESVKDDDDNMDETFSQKVNKWDKWHPKALKTRVSQVLKSDTATRASVTTKLDKLSAARLELVQLQMEIAKKQHQFVEEEHEMKMLQLANDERRKEEIHAVLIKKMKSGPVMNDMV